MSWREVTEADLAWVEPFLREHVQSSMFLLSNLAGFGLNGAGPYGTRLWCSTGVVRGIIGVSNSGYVLLQAPEATVEDWQATKNIWRDLTLAGCSGEAGQVTRFLQVTGLDRLSMALNSDEPGYVLALDQMQMPSCAGFSLAPVSEDNRALVERWRAAYHGEVLGTPEGLRLDAAKDDIANYIKRDSHRVLLRDGEPVAMTGFNAQLPDVVQIGAVFTPPEARGQGLARRAVALHLAEAAERGVTQAILFAANAAAARAYEAIGFQRKGSMSMAMFHQQEAVT